jgi:hypothetical protein
MDAYVMRPVRRAGRIKIDAGLESAQPREVSLPRFKILSTKISAQRRNRPPAKLVLVHARLVPWSSPSPADPLSDF